MDQATQQLPFRNTTNIHILIFSHVLAMFIVMIIIIHRKLGMRIHRTCQAGDFLVFIPDSTRLKSRGIKNKHVEIPSSGHRMNQVSII